MSNRFRESQNIEERVATLKLAFQNKVNLICWSQINEKRNLGVATITALGQEKDSIGLSLKLEDSHNLHQGQLLYFFDETNHTLFKGLIVQNNSSQEISIILDDKFLIKERRDNKRVTFDFLDIQATVAILPPGQSRPLVLNVDLIDISSGGMSFTVKELVFVKFVKGLTMTLVSIHGINLPQPILGEVVHITPVGEQNNNKLCNIGVKYLEQSKVLDEVIKALASLDKTNVAS